MPTQLKTRCSHCQTAVKVNESHVGKRVRCPACKQPFEVSSVELGLSGSASLDRALRAAETMDGAAAETGELAVGDSVAGERKAAGLGRLGRFELKELLGQGAFGRVYKAYDPQLDRYVALKIPTFGPDEQRKVQRFIAEAKAAARLRHPNIVPTYESGQIDGQYYIAAQFVAGQALSKRIKGSRLAESSPLAPRGTDAPSPSSPRQSPAPPKESPLNFRQAAEWVRQLAEALA